MMAIRDTQTFEAFVHDDRYSVPTLHLIAAFDEAAAQETARALLRASTHHLGVELCRDGQPLLALGTCAERRPTDASAPPAGLGG